MESAGRSSFVTGTGSPVLLVLARTAAAVGCGGCRGRRCCGWTGRWARVVVRWWRDGRAGGVRRRARGDGGWVGGPVGRRGRRPAAPGRWGGRVAVAVALVTLT